MPDYIEVTPPLEKLSNFIQNIPSGVKRAAWKAIGDYFLGNDSHGLRHYPPDRYFSRAQAGYKTSQAQMRFFFATGILESDGQGGVILNRYERTGQGSEAWSMSSNDQGLRLSNDAPGWTFVEGPNQAHQPRMVGWRQAIDIVFSNMNGAIRSAQQAVNKWINDQFDKG